MLVELKKGTWASYDECWEEGYVGCYDVNCNDNDDICCEECILNNVAKLPLDEVSAKEEERLQKLFIDCTEEELEEIKNLLKEKGYGVL